MKTQKIHNPAQYDSPQGVADFLHGIADEIAKSKEEMVYVKVTAKYASRDEIAKNLDRVYGQGKWGWKPQPKTPEELEVECQIARDIIAQYLAITATELAAERELGSPDQARVELLTARLKELHQEKMHIGLDRADLIQKAMTTYAEVVKLRSP